MKISVISVWYNEAFLAPFFLEHYKYADEILIFVDADTNDNTIKICSQYPNVKVGKFCYPDGYSCRLQVKKANEIALNLDSDWVISVDADELVFPIGMKNPRYILNHVKGNLLYAQMWQVYRHIMDLDLDSSKPAIWQRRHGDPNVSTGMNRLYNKPIIIKPAVGIEWAPGFHSYQKNDRIMVSNTSFRGVHWQMADVTLAIHRRIGGQKERQSKENLQHRWAMQHHYITEEAIRIKCKKHLYDPKLF